MVVEEAMRLHCKSCGLTGGEFSFPMNIGEVADQTGWQFIFVGEDTIWVCSGCWEKIHSHAEEIHFLIWGEVCTEDTRHERGGGI